MRGHRGDDTSLLFEQPTEFDGLPEEGFRLFSIEDREQRRQAILNTIHPELTKLGEDLLRRLSLKSSLELHAHLPRLDWPKGYQPFCTWLALSGEPHGYQAGPQLNVGVHAPYVAVRLGWDTNAPTFGRFEFLGRVGHLGPPLLELARDHGLIFRVYAAAAWPEGSRLVYETSTDLPATFDEVNRRGVWWELGQRFDLPVALPRVCSAEFGREAAAVFERMLPVYDLIVGEKGDAEPAEPNS